MLKNKHWLISFYLLLSCSTVAATELQPWFGKDKLLEFRLHNAFRTYTHVKTDSGSSHYKSNDDFFDISASIAPITEVSVEIEALTAATHHRSYGIDSFLFTARYLLFNDITAEAPVSVAIGITAERATRQAQYDISSFHHGRSDYETHVAIGKEFDCEGFWTSRLWGLAGYGFNRHHSGWWHGILAYEYNFWDLHQLGIRADGLWGQGHSPLHIHHFRDYGPVKHRSVDLSLHYTYFWEPVGPVEIAYAYRVWARNYPANAQSIILSITIPYNIL